MQSSTLRIIGKVILVGASVALTLFVLLIVLMLIAFSQSGI